MNAFPKPVHGSVPLIVGGKVGPRSARIATGWADEYNSTSASPAECRRRRRRLDAACEAAGRDPATLRLSVLMWLLTGRHKRAA